MLSLMDKLPSGWTEVISLSWKRMAIPDTVVVTVSVYGAVGANLRIIPAWHQALFRG